MQAKNLAHSVQKSVRIRALDCKFVVAGTTFILCPAPCVPFLAKASRHHCNTNKPSERRCGSPGTCTNAQGKTQAKFGFSSLTSMAGRTGRDITIILRFTGGTILCMTMTLSKQVPSLWLPPNGTAHTSKVCRIGPLLHTQDSCIVEFP